MGKFLIVTSFYNNTKKHVQTTFDNVLKQSYQDWILIVGDDFSDDPEFRTYLKNQVTSINDPRIIYYDVKYKRELYLYQNFFQEYEYDYYFDLDSDDEIDSNILKIYHNHFKKYPNVNSIYSDFNKVDEENNLQMLSLIQSPSNFAEEFNLRSTQDFTTIYSQRSGQHMFGVARAMRKPKENKLLVKELCRTATDSLFLFYSLTKGDHLHIPRRLYTYINRPNSDSSWMSTEEISKFNLNVELYKKKYVPSKFKNPYKNVWLETSAISSCKWIDNVSEFCLITNSDIDIDLIRFLYPDKKIVLNNFTHKNQVVVWNNLNPKIKSQLKLNNTNNCTVFFSDENYTYSPPKALQNFDNSSFKFREELNQYFNGYNWYSYFRQCIVTKISAPKLLVIQPHLSTGGCPQYLLDYLINFKDNYSEVKVVEATNLSREFIIQKNKLIELIGENNLITLGEFECSDEQWFKDKEQLISIIKEYSPDIIWMNEAPEGFEYRKIPNDILNKIYIQDRDYKIIETTHYNAFDFSKKQFIPDEFMFCSQKHIKDSKHIDIPKKVWEVPIKKKIRPNRKQTLINLGLDPNKFHVLNVGLFNDNKNQKYIFDIAEQTKDLPIQYHFIGNTCFINECKINNYQQNLPNCKIWGERNDVDIFMSCMDLYFFPSKKELNPLTIKEALSWDMLILANYDPNYSDQYKKHPNFHLIQDITFKKLLKQNFNIDSSSIDLKNQITVSFFESPRVNIDGINPSKYLVKFINNKTNKVIWEDTISNNMWTATNVKYYIEWRIEVWQNEKLIYNQILDYKNSRVLISLDSKSIGDTLAWFPYVEKFQQLHKCDLIVSTFHNEWFQSQYPNLTFVPPGSIIKDLKGIYSVGWFYNEDGTINYNNHPSDFRAQPLQKTASDILGIPYQEIKPKLFVPTLSREIKEKYIVIAPHGTKHAAYWHYPKGWQILVDYLNSKGYKVVMSSGEPLGDPWHDSKLGGTLTNVINKTGTCSLLETFSLISHAEALIGIGSGLAWVSWALNIPTVLISGFSEDYTEFSDCIRISPPPNTCKGCFNKYKLDGGDWSWCPEHKNTPRHFECSKSISPTLVINQIEDIL